MAIDALQLTNGNPGGSSANSQPDVTTALQNVFSGVANPTPNGITTALANCESLSDHQRQIRHHTSPSHDQ